MKQLIRSFISGLTIFLTYLFSTIIGIFSKICSIISPTKREGSELPSGRGLPIFGTIFSLIAAGGGQYLHKYIDGRHKQLGPIFKEAIGPVPAVIFVSDPKYFRKIYSSEGKYPNHILPESWLLYNEKYGCKRGLYFMDGEEWFFHRRYLNNIFLKADPNFGIEDLQNEIVSEFIEDWKKNLDTDIQVEEERIYQLSISFVVGSLMGENYLRHRDEFKRDIEILASFVYRIFDESCKLSLMPAKLCAFLNLTAWKRFVEYVGTALNLGQLMAEKMLKLSDENSIVKRISQEDVPKDIVTRIIVDLILAAVDTTSYTTEWAIYLLSRNPEVQDKLAGNTSNMTLLRGIVRETLRLYPSAPFITRSLPEDVQLGEYHIPAKTWFIMSIYTAGRDEQYFPHPEEFRPERWSKDEKGSLTSGALESNASWPYAIGSRSCVGRKLADAQIILTVKKLITNFRMVSLGESDIILRLVPVPKTPVRLHLSPRDTSSDI